MVIGFIQIESIVPCLSFEKILQSNENQVEKHPYIINTEQEGIPRLTLKVVIYETKENTRTIRNEY